MPTSSSNSPLLVFEPRWSAARCALVIAQCAICIVIPWLVPHWPVMARILLSIATLILLAVGYQRAGWWGPKRISRVIWQQSGEWVLSRASGVSAQAGDWAVLGESHVSAWLMVLRWRCEDSTARLVILPGDLSTAGRRQWQTRLKLQGSHQRETNPAAL